MTKYYALSVLLAGCGPSGSPGTECSLQDIEGRGRLVDIDKVECESCPREISWFDVMLETVCSPGVELGESDTRVALRVVATNRDTGQEFVVEGGFLGNGTVTEYIVTPEEPLRIPGFRLDDFIDEPGAYHFVVELDFGLPNVEFDRRVE